jgi:photosystem II stability/assembly factor-like uncharacterized protein
MSLRIDKPNVLFPIISNTASSISTNTGRNWFTNSATCSSDGQIVYAGTSNDYIYKSTDGGLTFTPLTSLPTNTWTDIATSSDGNYVIVCNISPSIFISNDGGLTWTSKITETQFTSVSITSAGDKMVACSFGRNVFISTDFGVNWTVINSISASLVRISGDGLLIVACENSTVYRSSNNGLNWVSSSVGGTIKNLALSNTGQYQILSSDLLGGIPNIYVSSDSGNSWGSSKRQGVFLQSSILAISSNGQYQIQAFTFSNNNTIAFSSDFGNTFIINPASLGFNNWRFVTMSSSGSNILLGLSTGVYKSTDTLASATFIPGTISTITTGVLYLPISSVKSRSPRII